MKKIKLDDLPQNMTLRELAQVAHAFGYELSFGVGSEPEPEPEPPCQGVTREGFRCKKKPQEGSPYCFWHRNFKPHPLEQP